MTEDTPLVALCPFRLPALLYGIAVVLVAIHVTINVYHYRVGDTPWELQGLFDLDREDSVPNWFSSGILFVGSVLALGVAQAARRVGDRQAGHWLGLALGFLFLSMDEVAGFHETLNTVSDIKWTIPGAILAAVVGLAYVPFLLRLPPRLRWRLILAGAVYVGGAVGVEHLSDYYVEPYGMDNLGYKMLTALEEGLEMVGAIGFIHVLLLHLEQTVSGSRALLGVVRSIRPGASI